MQPNTSDSKFTEQILRQVQSDARRAMIRARYCIERSKIERFACVDDCDETENRYGKQLWFFEGTGFDESDRRTRIYGVIEYSLQYGLHELVEDGVFESADQRSRFQTLYLGQSVTPSWRHPAHRWLLFGVICTFALFSLYLVYRWLGGDPLLQLG